MECVQLWVVLFLSWLFRVSFGTSAVDRKFLTTFKINILNHRLINSCYSSSLCKEETSSKPRNDTEQNQNVNLKRAQEILEKNRLKKKIAEDMKNRQEIYQYDQ